MQEIVLGNVKMINEITKNRRSALACPGIFIIVLITSPLCAFAQCSGAAEADRCHHISCGLSISLLMENVGSGKWYRLYGDMEGIAWVRVELFTDRLEYLDSRTMVSSNIAYDLFKSVSGELKLFQTSLEGAKLVGNIDPPRMKSSFFGQRYVNPQIGLVAGCQLDNGVVFPIMGRTEFVAWSLFHKYSIMSKEYMEYGTFDEGRYRRLWSSNTASIRALSMPRIQGIQVGQNILIVESPALGDLRIIDPRTGRSVSEYRNLGYILGMGLTNIHGDAYIVISEEDRLRVAFLDGIGERATPAGCSDLALSKVYCTLCEKDGFLVILRDGNSVWIELIPHDGAELFAKHWFSLYDVLGCEADWMHGGHVLAALCGDSRAVVIFDNVTNQLIKYDIESHSVITLAHDNASEGQALLKRVPSSTR